MKKLIAGILIISLSQLLMTSCNNDASSSSTMSTDTSTKMTTVDTAKMSSQTINTGGVSTSQNDFVNKVAIAGMMEVALGNLAQTNAASHDVKDFGKMMVADHTNAGNELKSIAASKNIAMPTDMDEEANMHVKDLSAKKGADFDKAYINMMVEGHEKVADEFKKAANENSDPDVKSFAAKTLPTIENHLAKAKNIKAKM